jgi:uncharacterized membrane protein (DUF441 family)
LLVAGIVEKVGRSLIDNCQCVSMNAAQCDLVWRGGTEMRNYKVLSSIVRCIFVAILSDHGIRLFNAEHHEFLVRLKRSLVWLT